MKIFALGLCLVLLVTAPPGVAQEGRTDGPEGSEYGKGGYPFSGREARLYLNPLFGSGIFEVAGAGDQTGLLYGLDVGYEMEEWIGLEGSYSYLRDRELSIFGLGSRFSYNRHPFIYSFTVQAGLYSQKTGDNNFGLAPGTGVDIVVGERYRVGLHYRRDFVFSDSRTRLNRVFARIGFYF